MSQASPLATVLQRDRLILLGALATLVTLAWLSMLRMARHDMQTAMATLPVPAWGAMEFFLTFWM